MDDIVTLRAVLDILPVDVRQALCDHRGPRRLYADGPDHEVYGWRCLQCDLAQRGEPTN